jgi:luciferase family oxidoreductase group 1
VGAVLLSHDTGTPQGPSVVCTYGLTIYHQDEGVPLPIPLSVLDLTPVPAGTTGGEALRNTIDLAKRADALGYERYWLAEHHNLPGIASSAPEVMMANVAAATDRIRVGSGGVMLPNHAPLHVAEVFRVLEALHPGRMDLGIGRAPGTDPVTAQALRGRFASAGADDFPEALSDLLGFLHDRMPAGHPFASVRAVPADAGAPPVWLLGSSGWSAQAAATWGLPYSFAAHFSPGDAGAAMRHYRERFQPSEWLDAPHSMVAVGVIAAEDDERARYLAEPLGLSWARIHSGRSEPLPTPEEAAAHPWTPAERQVADGYLSRQVIGGPETVRAGLERMVEDTGADELMLTTHVHGHDDRVRSYEIVADAMRDGG